ncbi:hypothetical protein QAD02_009109 [Eretmocerus hayati]|uniref:Uncharacterized protein n=1 Tax=Eretmocerus hayati TaxID=131215 RepID=A0ACC2N8Q1_9HYME|nr:hypothetical protein QAD02_009109 [Eretmocerus hayati]
MPEPSSSRVRKQRLLNQVFGDGDAAVIQDSENSSEWSSRPSSPQRLHENNPVQIQNFSEKGSRSSSQGSVNKDDPIQAQNCQNDSTNDVIEGCQNSDGSDNQLNELIRHDSGDQSPINDDELSAQSDDHNDSVESSEDQSESEQNVTNSDSTDEENSRSEEGSDSSAEPLEEVPEILALKRWALESRTPSKHLSSLLLILRERLLPQLPKTAKTYLGTTDAVYVVKPMIDSKYCEGEYAYLGLEEGLQACINVDLHPNHIIELDFNIDNLKLHKKNGIIIEGQHFSVQIHRFIADTQARYAVKNVEGHTLSCGCGRCKVVGRIVHNVFVVLDLDCEKRTPEGFRNYEDVDYHKGASVLLALTPNINFIYQFILDIMHLIYLGVVPRMLSLSLKGAPNSSVIRLSAQQKTELNRRTTMIKKDMPFEFKRKMSSTDHFEDYHAVDNRFFPLYCCPVVFKKLINNDYYKHWVLLHVATRMLSGPRTVEGAGQARQYMHQFVEESIILYGHVFCTINVHCLDHLADDVERAGCNLDLLTAFPYENEYGKLKNILLSPHRTVAQYCRKVHLQRSTGQIRVLPQESSVEMEISCEILNKRYKNY